MSEEVFKEQVAGGRATLGVEPSRLDVLTDKGSYRIGDAIVVIGLVG